METKKPFPFHPVLFALYPLLDLYVNVAENIPFRGAIRSMILIPLAALGLLFVLKWWIKDWDRAGFLATSTLFLLLFYGIIYRVANPLTVAGFRIGRHFILFPLWFAVIALISSRWAWKRLHDHLMVTKFLNFAAVVTLILSASRYALKQISSPTVDPQVFVTMEQQWEQEADFTLSGATPDIYYIILDGYARADVLQDLYDIDNTAFLDFLKSRGFYVADASQANYIQTALSLSSSLNFTYLDDLQSLSAATDRSAIGYLISHSRMRSLLATRGYKLITADTGYPFTTILDADVIYTPKSSSSSSGNAFEGLVLVSSAGVLLVDSGLIEVPSIGYDRQRARIQSAFEYLTETLTLPGPKFVFFHIVAPHPPFVFDRDGNPVIPDVPYGGGDGSHFAGSVAQYLAGYREQVLYVNTQMMHILDTLLTQAATPPIIILQGDHGPGAYLDWRSPEKSCLKERIAILNAYYLPNGDYSMMYPGITPVNTFRVVLNSYFGVKLDLLDDRSYYTAWDRPYDFIELGEKAQIPCTVESRQ